MKNWTSPPITACWICSSRCYSPMGYASRLRLLTRKLRRNLPCNDQLGFACALSYSSRLWLRRHCSRQNRRWRKWTLFSHLGRLTLTPGWPSGARCPRRYSRSTDRGKAHHRTTRRWWIAVLHQRRSRDLLVRHGSGAFCTSRIRSQTLRTARTASVCPSRRRKRNSGQHADCGRG